MSYKAGALPEHLRADFEDKNLKKIVMLTQEQIEIIIESLEELRDVLSEYNEGHLFTEQLRLLQYLKQLKK